MCSFERAIQMVKFKHNSRNLLQLTYIATYNAVQTADPNDLPELMNIHFDEVFAETNMTIINPKAKLQAGRSFGWHN